MSFPCISIEAWEVGLLTEVKTVGRGSNIPKINRLSKVSEHKQCPWLVPGVCHCWCIWCSLYSFFSIATAVWQTLCRSVEQVFGVWDLLWVNTFVPVASSSMIWVFVFTFCSLWNTSAGKITADFSRGLRNNCPHSLCDGRLLWWDLSNVLNY